MAEDHATSNITTNLDGREFVITRIFDTPRELVFKAWTESEHLMGWWGPLTENEGKTALTLRGGPVNATEEEHKTYEAGLESMKPGFGGTFNQLAEYLAKA